MICSECRSWFGSSVSSEVESNECIVCRDIDNNICPLCKHGAGENDSCGLCVAVIKEVNKQIALTEVTNEKLVAARNDIKAHFGPWLGALILRFLK